MGATTSITIRQVPAETRDELAARAARSGQSLQEYLYGQLVALAAKPDPNDLMRQVRLRAATLGTSLAADQILAHRDEDRR